MKGKYSVFLLALIIVVLFPGVETKAKSIEKDRVLKIEEFPNDEILSLDGKWEFYWNSLLTPEDFRQKMVDKSPYIAEVPNDWTNYVLEGKKLPGEGYATYRMIIEIPEDEVGTIKSVYMPSVASAYTLWIDGKVMSSNGIVRKSRKTMVPESIPKVFPFEIHSKTMEVILQVSNFNQRKAGIFDPILIGEPEVISHYFHKKVLYRTMIITSLLIIGLYHFILYFFRKKEPSLIFFGIVCFSVGIRAILLEEGLTAYVLPFLDWEIARKLEYLGASLGILFFSLFTWTQFTKEMNGKIRRIIITILSMYSLFVCVTPAVIFTKTMVPLQVVIMIIFIYLLYVYIRAFINKREGALLNAIAILMLFSTAVNDFLYFNFLVQTTELTSAGLLFFLFTQSIIISKRYSTAFNRKEKLSKELFSLNALLEKQVEERTEEITRANKELQVVNKKLSEASYWRNKWVHNISHDIATPLTSIRAYARGMLDGVVPNEKKYLQLIYDQGLYLSQVLHDLQDITDMPAGKITMDQRKVSIKLYLLSLYKKYKIAMEEQGIHFLFQDKLLPTEEPFVLLDPVKIEQVIVNFINNAQRFVCDVGGKIVIKLEKEVEGFVKIKVLDNGTGIKEEEQELIFERFYKGSQQGNNYKSTGLGLAIAKEIIEHHNGQIGVESILGKGSCFYFSLPIMTDEKAAE